jgi:hypothetical protein
LSILSPIKTSDYFFKAEDQTIQWLVHSSLNVLQDITGWTAQFKMSVDQGTANVLTKNSTVKASTSTISVAFLAADTNGLDPLTYWYQLVRTDSGFNSVLAHGDFVLQARTP